MIYRAFWLFSFICCLKTQTSGAVTVFETDEIISKVTTETQALAQEVETKVWTVASTQSDFYAQLDPVVFKSAATYGPTVTVIHAQDLEDKSYTQVLDLLRNEAGLDVVSTGGVGQTTSVFIRGAKSEHTLVLIDGIEVNDPSTPTRLFDFSNMTTESIKRIEVYRGAQTVRFGPDALGGVINIITKSDGSQPQSLVHIEAGSFGTLGVSLEHLNHKGPVHWLTGANYSRLDGFSAADSGTDSEADSFERFSFNQKIKWNLNTDAHLEALARFSHTQTDLDFEGGPNGDDPNYETKSTQYLVGLKYRHSFFDLFQTQLGFSYTAHDRDYDNAPDALHPTLYKELFKSQNSKFENLNSWQLSTQTRLDAILQYREERASSEQNLDGTLSSLTSLSQSFFGQALILEHTHKDLTLQVGTRHDQAQYTRTESLWSHSLSAEYTLSPSFKINSNIGTAVKTPSLFQLHSSFGNPDLRSEKAWTWDIAAEKVFNDTHHLIVSIFGQHYTQLIDFDSTLSAYGNISDVEIYGAELSTFHSLSTNFELQTHYKFLNAKDKAQNQKLLRRPDHTLSAQLKYQIAKFNFHLGLRYVDGRPDLDPVTWSRISLASYVLGDFMATYELKTHWRLKGRIENLWDEKYQNIAGYKVSPQAFYLSLSGSF